MRPFVADAFSGFRFIVALPVAYAIGAGLWNWAAFGFFAAAASDVIDGPLARRWGTSRPRGALLDHGADAFFVATAQIALAWRGTLPALLPVLVGLAFAQYTWDSEAHRGRALRGSAVGRINGIAYYVLVGAWVVAEGWLPSARETLYAVSVGLIGTTAFSMSQRLRARLG